MNTIAIMRKAAGPVIAVSMPMVTATAIVIAMILAGITNL